MITSTLVADGERPAFSIKAKDNFDQNGYFFGSAYGFNISEFTVFTLNAALAFLDGELAANGSYKKLSSTPGGATNEEPAKDFHVKSIGDTVGLSLGAVLKGRFSEGLSYTLGINGNSYDFKNKDVEVTNFSESVLRFSAGLSYRF
jgi:hypothetical protein